MISILDLFKIGIGPSSSHTVGPMRAAKRFLQGLEERGQLEQVRSIQVELFGSLALTGKGHGTDRAILLGLCGEAPDLVIPDSIESTIARIRQERRIFLLGHHPVPFDSEKHLLFHRQEVLPGHSNGMRFTAVDEDGRELQREVWYSVGGGFIVAENEQFSMPAVPPPAVPYPFQTAADLLRLGQENGQPIWRMVLENERALHPQRDIEGAVGQLWQAMKDCTERGLRTEGILPGGLQVRRRAPQLYAALTRTPSSDPLAVVDWINVFAIAVNEENAAGGRVVTAPTNGAAGIVPAVAHYYEKFSPGASPAGILHYFLTAGAIGILYKENASISGSEVGCQGEVGVACSMAAAGLAAALGASNEQVEHAAEIAMEHNLGMTCDPIGGLVQIPCIERNAIGAVKAVNATRMAMNEAGDHKVSLDQVIRTMRETGRDMQSRYKETSLAGLAVHVVEC
ncbi:MAG: L-serine ammonia-lyase [Acidobacteria bacterium]|nr:L-serine ammonia-lyase [Acidobacteriota bacterium]